MNINVWSNFSKRVNSTKRPTNGTQKTVILKEETDIENPTFILDTTDFTINYVEAFGHYYFAKCRNLDGRRTAIDCTMDPMATYKSQIGSTSALIEYAASSSNVAILDPRNQPTDLITTTATTITLSGLNFNKVGCYVVGVLSDTANGNTGLLDYYVMSASQMGTFNANLNDQNFLTQLQNSFTNATDSLVSCIWLPLSGIGSGSNPVHIGSYTLPAPTAVSKVVDRVYSFASGLTTIGFSSISGGAGANMTYLERPPYCSGELFLPFVGWVPLDMDLLAYAKSIQVNGYVDIVTGDIVFKVAYGSVWVSTFNGNIATKVPVSSATYDAVGVAGGTLTAIGGIAAAIATATTGGSATALIGAAGTFLGGSFAAAKSTELHTMINGSNSSALGAQLGLDAYALIHQNIPTETNLTAIRSSQGLPMYEVHTISSLSGFVKCSNASADIPGDKQEKDIVNSYLNSGFYYE